MGADTNEGKTSFLFPVSVSWRVSAQKLVYKNRETRISVLPIWIHTDNNFLVPGDPIFLSMSIIIAEKNASIIALWDSSVSVA